MLKKQRFVEEALETYNRKFFEQFKYPGDKMMVQMQLEEHIEGMEKIEDV
jgi:hypothetical protein